MEENLEDYEIDLELANIFESLGLCLKASNENSQAVVKLKRALDFKKSHLPGDHPEIFVLSKHLAELYEKSSQYDDALTMLNSGLQQKLAKLQIEQSAVASTYNTMATLYQKQGDNEKALEYYNKALLM